MSKVRKNGKAGKKTNSTPNGKAVSGDHAHHLLHQMMRIRRLEEKSAELYSAMKIRGFLHLYIGEEAVAVGAIEALKPEDNIVATYREHGHALIRGISANQIMAEMFGKQEGCSRGRGGSMHLFCKDLNFFGGNAIVGGGLPLAVGLGLASKMQSKKNITCCLFGEGAVAEGEFHESMNLAALWQLPVLFICENNLYAMGTALKLSESVTDITKKADAYDIKAEAVDGMDVLAVEKSVNNAIKYVRSGKGPYLLECRTYRFRAHSMFDPELYRTKEEVEEWKKRDPINNMIKLMKSKKLIRNKEIEKLNKKVEKEMQEAVDFAESGTWEPVEDLTKYVYSEMANEKVDGSASKYQLTGSDNDQKKE
ncbi:MAG TPA: pyruvate dehydrogenase (acetyl-transferring) E1 component subunit alpha [Balneolales bacterium]|nr:pyruvate dehydrogenase (acetyl-transferring) E1 component subunit alpha [Balneolales bacterium]